MKKCIDKRATRVLTTGNMHVSTVRDCSFQCQFGRRFQRKGDQTRHSVVLLTPNHQSTNYPFLLFVRKEHCRSI